jgi:adenosylcobinamide kinase/adenosylcobinamide-phosphate guanylyltransferase
VKVLVTGGVRSGKSRHAEALLASAGAVAYVAPGPAADDADWAERIAAHRAARPESWTTLETHDLAVGLATDRPVIVDCLGTWLTAVLDEHALWEAPAGEAAAVVEAELIRTRAALAARTADTVLVSNEVGLGVVPSHRSGRVFRDLLGYVNQELAAVCDEVHLVIAGRVLKL